MHRLFIISYNRNNYIYNNEYKTGSVIILRYKSLVKASWSEDKMFISLRHVM